MSNSTMVIICLGLIVLLPVVLIIAEMVKKQEDAQARFEQDFLEENYWREYR